MISHLILSGMIMTALDQFSLVTIPLELFFNGTLLGQGTGFIWREDGQHYLVTNWHVLSGCDFFTKKLIRCDGGRPNTLRTLFTVATSNRATVMPYAASPVALAGPETTVDLFEPFGARQYFLSDACYYDQGSRSSV